MKLSGFYAALIACVLPIGAMAQLVADGQTNVLNGVYTYSPGSLTVGTNGAFTLLIITNGATVLNTGGNAVIGSNASAETNRVVVTGAGSFWQSDNGFYVGQSGSASELDILNGGNVTDISGYIGGNSASSNNLVQISGVGSTWTNTGNLYVGNGSSRNTLIVTNGGKVFSGSSGVGENGSGPGNNFAVITGAGSSWSSSYFYLGYMDGGNNQFLINNGGSFVTSSTFDIGPYCGSNCLTVADAGSSLQCQTFRIGYSSTSNQCIISNGATFTVLYAGLAAVAATVEGTYTIATVTGSGSVWTNAGDFDFGQTSNVLAITSGGRLVDNNGYIGNGFGKSNVVIVAGANSVWENLGDLHVTDVGAQVIITNGGMVANNNGYLGDSTGNINCYVLVSGSGSVWTNRDYLYVGNNGASNQLVVANSGKVAASAVYLGNNSSNNQLVVANSGTLTGSTLYVGYNGSRNQMVVSNSGIVTIGSQLLISGGTGNSNTLTVNGGTVIVTNSVMLGSYGTIAVNSGLFKAASLSANGGGAPSKVIFNGGTLQLNGTSYGNAAPFVVGDGADAATFQMLNSGTHSFSGGLVVSSNALLTGAGTVNGNVSIGNGGTFAPGSTNFWTLNMNSGLVLSNGSTSVMGLNVHYNSIYVVYGATNVVYGGTLQLTNLASPTPFTSGQTYDLFYASNYSGAFSNLVPATPGPGLRWDTNELNIDGVLRIFPTHSQPPVLGSNVAIASGNLILSASSGIPYDPVYLLTSTNVATPITNWTYCATNYFGTNGAVSITNAIVPGEPQRYFRLQVP